MSDFLAYIAKEEKFNFNYSSGFGTIYFNKFKDLECRPMREDAKCLEGITQVMGGLIAGTTLLTMGAASGLSILLGAAGVGIYYLWAVNNPNEDRPTPGSLLMKKFNKIIDYFYKKTSLKNLAIKRLKHLLKRYINYVVK